MSKMWKKIENFIESVPVHLNENDQCFYAREYISGGGYACSEANSLMNNFKKPVSKRGSGEWYYKERAIKQLARELAPTLVEGFPIFCVPQSKTKDHPEYDPRFDMLFVELRSLKNMIVTAPIRYSSSQMAAHDGGTRTPEVIKSNYIWDGFGDTCPGLVYIIDDVLTTGGHFRACKDFVLEHCPDTKVLGYFFCKAVFADDSTL